MYSDDLAHRIYAGVDALLVPSAFEPCGLTQLIALRYGTVPIVHEVGGLKDTVEPYNEYEERGNGFFFRRIHVVGIAGQDRSCAFRLSGSTGFLAEDPKRGMSKTIHGRCPVLNIRISTTFYNGIPCRTAPSGPAGPIVFSVCFCYD
jgi:hypothetical protein